MNLKSSWLVLTLTAFITVGLSCERQQVEQMSKNSEPKRIDFSRYLWKNRPVLIFAPSDQDSHYIEQKTELEEKTAELNDRDIILIELFEAGGSKVSRNPVNDEQHSLLKKEFDVRDGFTFILIGKDGTVKLKSARPVSSEDLFALIDSMPMRKQEMRQKASRSQDSE
jgi:hypothetical protein